MLIKYCMKVIFLGKDKPAVLKGLQFLIRNKFKIVATNKLGDKKFNNICKLHNIKTLTENQLYEKKFFDIDLVISYLYPNKIKKDLLLLPKLGCINFHPAPLPNYRGVCGYSFGIFEKIKKWGVSAHFVDNNFDTGNIIKVKRFSIDHKKETAFSLEQKSQLVLFELFKEVIYRVINNKKIKSRPQKKGRYFSKKDFEKLRMISQKDNLEAINRKIRACWFPPYPGVSININGQELTLVNELILNQVSEDYYES